MKYLRKCQRNIYSDDEGYTDSENEILSSLNQNKFEKNQKVVKDQFYGVYKHPKMQYLEMILKDEFN